MANWGNLNSRGKVEDRRGMSPVLMGGGGLGIGGVVIYLLFSYLSGGQVSPDAINSIIQNSQVQTQSIDTSQFAGQDSYEVFVSTVLGSTNDMWGSVFVQNNKEYTEPKLVLFRGSTQSACGGAYAAEGPHYCPEDETIYLDETFFDELTQKLGAKGGDVAQAYVIAHEVGHHAQNLLGIMGSHPLNQTGEGSASVELELQADCFAGLWAYSIKDRGVFEPGEISEALDAAAAVGDDRIQKLQEGHVSPETWTHGSSVERVSWFTKGYDTGSVAACDTFAQ